MSVFEENQKILERLDEKYSTVSITSTNKKPHKSCLQRFYSFRVNDNLNDSADMTKTIERIYKQIDVIQKDKDALSYNLKKKETELLEARKEVALKANEIHLIKNELDSIRKAAKLQKKKIKSCEKLAKNLSDLQVENAIFKRRIAGLEGQLFTEKLLVRKLQDSKFFSHPSRSLKHADMRYSEFLESYHTLQKEYLKTVDQLTASKALLQNETERGKLMESIKDDTKKRLLEMSYEDKRLIRELQGIVKSLAAERNLEKSYLSKDSKKLVNKVLEN